MKAVPLYQEIAGKSIWTRRERATPRDLTAVEWVSCPGCGKTYFKTVIFRVIVSCPALNRYR
jgi:4-hydroxy-3-methylbut-2-en-1-yl diphosphate synthase IspG/GcpE